MYKRGDRVDPEETELELIIKEDIIYSDKNKFHFIMAETDEHIPLPDMIEISDTYPGEPKFLRKRRHPKALRFYKVKRDSNPSRFFLTP